MLDSANILPASAPPAHPPASGGPAHTGILVWLGLGAAVLAFFALVFALASDTPQGDDFLALIDFGVRWQNTSGWRASLALLAEPHFSHRLVLTKAVLLAQLGVSGSIDFLALQLLGWLALTATAAALVLSSRAVRSAPWLALPAVLLIFQPQGYTNFHSAMQALQNFGILAVAFAALGGVTAAHPLGRISSLPLAALAAFTSANGLLVGPLAVVFAWLQRRRVLALAHATLASTVFIVYFHQFTIPPAEFHFRELVAKACIMAGGAFGFDRAPLVAITVIGASLLAGASWLVLSGGRAESSPRLQAFLTFLLGSVGLAALGRLGWTDAYMTQDRYRIYGILLAASGYLLLLDRPLGRRRGFRLTSLAGAAVFSLASFVATLPTMLNYSRWAKAQALNAQNGVSFFLTSGGIWEHASRSVAVAADRGLYRFPRYFSPAELTTLSSLTVASAPIRSVQVQPDGGVLGNILYFELSPDETPPNFGVLRLSGQNIVLPLLRPRARLADLLTRGQFFARRVGFVLPQELAVPGSHSLTAFARGEDDSLQPVWTATVTLPPVRPTALH